MKYLLLGGILVAVYALVRWSRDRVVQIQDWTPWRAEQASEVTARMLLGRAGPVRIVGSREHDRVMADRERRAGQAEWRQAQRKRAI